MVEMSLQKAQEAPFKEAIYAIDQTNPLGLYDCLIPEIAAYRPLRLDKMTYELSTTNYENMLKYKTVKY